MSVKKLMTPIATRLPVAGCMVGDEQPSASLGHWSMVTHLELGSCCSAALTGRVVGKRGRGDGTVAAPHKRASVTYIVCGSVFSPTMSVDNSTTGFFEWLCHQCCVVWISVATSPLRCVIGTEQELRYSTIVPDTM